MPRLCVLIVNWNACDEIRSCLQSVVAQIGERDQVIVVDNGSDDDSAAMISAEFPVVQLIETGSNLGFAEGCNRGLDLAVCDWVFTLTNDAIIGPGALEAARKAAAEMATDVGMLQPRIVFRDRPDRTNSTGVLIMPDGCARDRDFDVPVRSDDTHEEIFCPTAGAALYRQDMLSQVRLETGIFDRTYFMYFEDVDLGWRSRLAGWRAVYIPEAVITHAWRGSSTGRGIDFIGFQYRLNRLRTLAKNASCTMLLTSLPKTLSHIFWIGLHRGVRGLAAVWIALRDGFAQRPYVQSLAAREQRTMERAWFRP
jgi:GT2 family glycosyltransferase